MNLAQPAMSRKGRPPKTGPRKPSGDLKSRPDFGTPEVIAKRIALVGAADVTLAGYPLGVMLARELIDQQKHDAGLGYGRAYRIAIERPTLPPISPMTRRIAGKPSEVPEDVWLKAVGHWRACAAALIGDGRKTKDLVDNLVVFQRWPLWLAASVRSSERERTIRGLQILAEVRA